MLRNSMYARIIACAAGVSMIVPVMPVSAAPQVTRQVSRGTDIVLVKGELNGKLLNANGKPIDGAVVSVSRNGKTVAKTATLTDGSYTVKGLSSGTHTVSMADGQFPVRLWSEQAAPANSHSQFVVAETAVRGQFTGMGANGALYAVGGVAFLAGLALGNLIGENQNDQKPAPPASP